MMQPLLEQVFSDKYNSQEYLEEIVEEYPYFTAAHFGLLQQINKNERSYDSQLARTALHFNNAPLLDLLLNTVAKTTLPELHEMKEHLSTEPIAEELIQEPVSIIPISENQSTEDKKTDDVPVFEPLYTTDYFASQGIKLSEEIKANDKLGKQLKSFTEWLKTMKKVHPGQKNETIVVDTTVEKLAEKSNEDAEIITEAMAEVYESQGKYKKAKEIYQKLSLQNPAKSAFFAAKLEQIKDH